jgi:hypothetical protein
MCLYSFGVGPAGPLPADFARQLAEILEPGDEHAAAQVLQAAIRLDDARLGSFLELVAERVRSSAQPITGDELRGFLLASTRGGRAGPSEPGAT